MKKGNVPLRIFLYASLISLVWLGSYVALSGVFSVKAIGPEQPKITQTPVTELPLTVSTQWTVLAVTDEEREIEEFWLCYTDFLADTLVFLEVPPDTKVELAAGGYEVLSVHHPEMPELFKVSDLCHIFSEATWCLAAEEAGASLLGVRPKGSFFLEKAVFESITEKKDGKVVFALPGSVKDTIITVMEKAVTNRTLEEVLVYLESYRDVDRILYETLPGTMAAEEYRTDSNAIKERLEQLELGIFETEE